MELTQEQIESCRFIVNNLISAHNFFPYFGENYGEYKECVIKSELITNTIYSARGVYVFTQENGKKKSKKFLIDFQLKKSILLNDDNHYFLSGFGHISIKGEVLRIFCTYKEIEEYWSIEICSYRNFNCSYNVDPNSGKKVENKNAFEIMFGHIEMRKEKS